MLEISKHVLYIHHLAAQRSCETSQAKVDQNMGGSGIVRLLTRIYEINQYLSTKLATLKLLMVRRLAREKYSVGFRSYLWIVMTFLLHGVKRAVLRNGHASTIVLRVVDLDCFS